MRKKKAFTNKINVYLPNISIYSSGRCCDGYKWNENRTSCIGKSKPL